MSDAMNILNHELDAISYDWLVTQHSGLASAIENAVAEGNNPIQIKRAVLRQTGRSELALRCEQAARHLGRG
jgi:hypothetical protein